MVLQLFLVQQKIEKNHFLSRSLCQVIHLLSFKLILIINYSQGAPSFEDELDTDEMDSGDDGLQMEL